MRNKERQNSLDKNKWIMSQECGEDLSGEMLYCEFCHHCVKNVCTKKQEEREELTLCAKAFNRMKRKEAPKTK